MAIYRNVQMSFWTDPKISDDYTPKDKLFYLYLMTNPHTNLCGCYEISAKQISNEIGYTMKEVDELIDRAENIHHAIAYSDDTKELLIIRWGKYNWTTSERFRKPLLKEIDAVKCDSFREFLMNNYNGKEDFRYGIDTVSTNSAYGIDTVSQSSAYGIDTTVTVTDTVSDTVEDIVNYLNTKCGTKYKASSESTKKHIRARLAEGYTEDDFRTVIDKKYDEWHGTEQEKYLRPETLFGSKFEGYLNQKINSPPKKNKFDNFEQRKYNFDDLERQLLKGG